MSSHRRNETVNEAKLDKYPSVYIVTDDVLTCYRTQILDATRRYSQNEIVKNHFAKRLNSSVVA